MNRDLISIIIPSYNSIKYISQTIQSVLNQSWKPLEIIVVDDGSTDGSIDTISEFPVKLLVQQNLGACVARNRGFMECNGTFIQFLDADDLLSPNKIEDQVKQLNGQNDIISNGRWGRFYTEYPLNENIKWGPDVLLEQDLTPVDWLSKNKMSQTGCWLTPRNLIEKAGLWDESLSINQDGEFFSRVVAQSKLVLYCSEARVYYRSGTKVSITSNTKSKHKLISLFKTCQSFEKVLLSLEDSMKTRLACANKYQDFIYGTYPRQMNLILEAERRIEELGGSNWPTYPAGKIAEWSKKVFGWKATAWIKYLTNR